MDSEAADVLPDRIISHQPSAQGTLGLTQGEKKDYYHMVWCTEAYIEVHHP